MSAVFPLAADTRFRRYVASAGQTAFAIPFPWQDDDDIAVVKIVGDAETPLTYPGQFTLTGAGSPAGGMATLVTPCLAGDIVIVIGDAEMDRVTSVVRAGKFASEPIDSDLDRALIRDLELMRETTRAVKSDYGVTPPAFKASTADRLLTLAPGNQIVSSETPVNEKTLRELGDAALGSLIGQSGAIEVPFYDSRLAASFAKIKPTINSLLLGGYSAAADGYTSVLYKRGNGNTPGGFFSADGAGWEIGQKEVPASAFGFVSDEDNPIEASRLIGGSTIVEGAFQQALDFCRSRGLIFLVDQHYWLNEFLMLKQGVRLRCAPGRGRLIAAASSPALGGFIVGHYGPTVSVVTPVADIQTWDLDIDCNRKAAMNGVAITQLSDAHFNGTTRVRGTLHDAVFKGGRATQFEGGDCKDIHFDRIVIEDCSIGINSQGLPSPSADQARHITYASVVMKNVGLPFNVDDTTSGSENLLPDRMSTTIGTASLFNCGRPDWVDSSDGHKGGIITGDRGSGLFIANLRVVNENSYGLVGGLFKGTMYGVVVAKAELYGQFNRIADFNYLDFMGASAGSHASWIEASVNWRGGFSALPVVLDTKAGGAELGNARLTFAAAPAGVTAICSANAGAYDNAMITLVDLSTGVQQPMRSAKQIYAAGNTMQILRGSQRLEKSRFDLTNNTPRTFFLVPLPINGRLVLDAAAAVFSPLSASTAACAISTALIAVARDGSGVFTSAIQSSPPAVAALRNYASLTLTWSVQDVSGTHAAITVQQSNNLAATMAGTMTIQAEQAVAGGVAISIVEGGIS